MNKGDINSDIEEKEDEELSKLYSDRALSEDKWIIRPEGMDLLEFFERWEEIKDKQKKK